MEHYCVQLMDGVGACCTEAMMDWGMDLSKHWLSVVGPPLNARHLRWPRSPSSGRYVWDFAVVS